MNGLPEQRSLRSLALRPRYDGVHLGTQLILPCLSQSQHVRAISAFFSLTGLKAVSTGLDRLSAAGGKMCAVMSLQDATGSPFAMVLRDREALRERVEDVAKQIATKAATITELIEREALATLGWMLESGLLQIKVAAVKADGDQECGRGILHQKIFVFTDTQNDAVSAEGSMNFTENGMEWHSESLLVFRSWAQSDYFSGAHQRIEQVWSGEAPDLLVYDLAGDVLERLAAALKKLGRKPIDPIFLPNHGAATQIFEVMTRSPEFAAFNTLKVPLYPHQERALVHAVSRTPIRVMFSDDVGLGKTIEAAATISYGLKFLGWKRVIIMVPAGLVVQWQEELDEKAGIPSLRLDRTQRAFLDSEGTPHGFMSEQWPPGVLLVSVQLASRSSDCNAAIIEASRHADCLVMDEAHAARRVEEQPGSFRQTLIFNLLDAVSRQCPNLLLLTATPMQSQQEELVALLEQMGIPKTWADRDFFRIYHQLLSVQSFTGEDAAILDRAQRATERIDRRFNPQNTYQLIGKTAAFRASVVESCITPRLVIRNTRNALGKIGYQFPKRIITASNIQMPPEAQRIVDAVENYIFGCFGTTEEIIFGSENALGFVSVVYYQRIVSSFHSAYRTLEKRCAKLEDWLATDFENQADDDLESSDDDFSSDPPKKRPLLSENQRKHARICCRQEIQTIEAIVDDVKAFAIPHADRDPKMEVLAGLVKTIVAKNEPLLIFSRYTDTTEAVIAVIEPILRAAMINFGYYSGSECWFTDRDRRIEAKKDGIVSGLRLGKIGVLICTDAASEGLNLQVASHLINVDVPWNPARLEQRFGRIDRLGQKAQSVNFYNLWYPNSIEERMYSRLLKVAEQIGVSVGVMADTVGTAIRHQLATRSHHGNTDLEAALARIGRLQDELNLRAIEEICGPAVRADNSGLEFRESLLWSARFLENKCQQNEVSALPKYTAQLLLPGQETIGLFSSIWRHLKDHPVTSSLGAAVVRIDNGALPICAAIEFDAGYRVLGTMETSRCFFSALSGTPFDISQDIDLPRGTISWSALEAVLYKRFPGRADAKRLQLNSVATWGTAVQGQDAAAVCEAVRVCHVTIA